MIILRVVRNDKSAVYLFNIIHVQELYDEIAANAELKKAFTAAAKSGRVVEFAKENGCDAPDEEITAFAAPFETDEDVKVLSPEELDNVAGGKCNDYDSCNHRGKGGLEGGYKKDYTNNYWYQRNQCGYCKKRITAVTR